MSASYGTAQQSAPSADALQQRGAAQALSSIGRPAHGLAAARLVMEDHACGIALECLLLLFVVCHKPHLTLGTGALSRTLLLISEQI